MQVVPCVFCSGVTGRLLFQVIWGPLKLLALVALCPSSPGTSVQLRHTSLLPGRLRFSPAWMAAVSVGLGSGSRVSDIHPGGADCVPTGWSQASSWEPRHPSCPAECWGTCHNVAFLVTYSKKGERTVRSPLPARPCPALQS